jgi:hypothetical protein
MAFASARQTHGDHVFGPRHKASIQQTGKHAPHFGWQLGFL